MKMHLTLPSVAVLALLLAAFSTGSPVFFTAAVLIVLLGLVLFIIIAIGAIKVFWPVLLMLFIFWLLAKALK